MRYQNVNQKLLQHMVTRKLLGVVALTLIAGAVVQPSAATAAVKQKHAPKVGCVAIAHRGGANPTTDENTTQAIRRDGRFNAWAEVDLRRLRSGALVLMHDDTLQRTTNGWGKVETRSLAYIKSLRTQPNGQRVPTLEEALVAAKAAHTSLYVELKRWQQHWKPRDLVAISRLVRRHHMQPNVYFGGTRAVLEAFEARAPGLKTFWRAKNRDVVNVGEARKRSVQVVQTKTFRVTPRSVKHLKAGGYIVALQSANSRMKWREAHRLGIRVVQTNFPSGYTRWCRTQA